MCEYPIVSIEDPFDQDDWEHYTKLTAEIGEQVQIVGDDLLVTNPKVCTHDYLWYLLFEDRFLSGLHFRRKCTFVQRSFN